MVFNNIHEGCYTYLNDGWIVLGTSIFIVICMFPYHWLFELVKMDFFLMCAMISVLAMKAWQASSSANTSTNFSKQVKNSNYPVSTFYIYNICNKLSWDLHFSVPAHALIHTCMNAAQNKFLLLALHSFVQGTLSHMSATHLMTLVKALCLHACASKRLYWYCFRANSFTKIKPNLA